jgi:putative CocE/NonD family hydrolase
MGASFQTDPLEHDTEVTGPICLRLWAASSTEDLDVFATIRHIDSDGHDIWEVGQQGQDVPVTRGWLRASHRKLVPELSTPYRPYHAHDERWPLAPDEPVELQIEIWPTCMVFRKGHRIRLDITPRDGVGAHPYTHYNADYKTGTNTLLSGPEHPSFLLLPVIPAA